MKAYSTVVLKVVMKDAETVVQRDLNSVQLKVDRKAVNLDQKKEVRRDRSLVVAKAGCLDLS